MYMAVAKYTAYLSASSSTWTTEIVIDGNILWFFSSCTLPPLHLGKDQENVRDEICQNSSVPQGVMGPGYTQKLHHVQESYQLREKWRSEHDLGLEHLPLKYHEFLICHA